MEGTKIQIQNDVVQFFRFFLGEISIVGLAEYAGNTIVR